MGALLADIYLGKITKWNDPAIAALNPDLMLPDRKIEVVPIGPRTRVRLRRLRCESSV